MNRRSKELIEALGLEPHPEGGFYRELFRSEARVRSADGRGERAALTTIYFLLPRGTWSRWHRVRSDEVWHLLEGGPLELFVADDRLEAVQRVVLAAAAGTTGPTHAVAADAWQAARPMGEFALCGCTVGPGFEFQDFALMQDDAAASARLRRNAPGYAALI